MRATSRMNVNDKLGDFKALAVSVNSMIQSMMEVVTALALQGVNLE